MTASQISSENSTSVAEKLSGDPRGEVHDIRLLKAEDDTPLRG